MCSSDLSLSLSLSVFSLKHTSTQPRHRHRWDSGGGARGCFGGAWLDEWRARAWGRRRGRRDAGGATGRGPWARKGRPPHRFPPPAETPQSLGPGRARPDGRQRRAVGPGRHPPRRKHHAPAPTPPRPPTPRAFNPRPRCGTRACPAGRDGSYIYLSLHEARLSRRRDSDGPGKPFSPTPPPPPRHTPPSPRFSCGATERPGPPGETRTRDPSPAAGHPSRPSRPRASPSPSSLPFFPPPPPRESGRPPSCGQPVPARSSSRFRPARPSARGPCCPRAGVTYPRIGRAPVTGSGQARDRGHTGTGPGKARGPEREWTAFSSLSLSLWTAFSFRTDLLPGAQGHAAGNRQARGPRSVIWAPRRFDPGSRAWGNVTAGV